MDRWTRIIQSNKPRKVPVDAPPEWLICTDASRWGWGYLAVNSGTNEVRTFGARWSDHMEKTYGDQLGSSVFAEPKGVVNSVLHLLSVHDPVRRVRIATDNTATRFSFQRGFSSVALHLNQCIMRLKEIFPDLVIDMMYIPGEENPADGPSRGKPLTAVQAHEAAGDLLRVMG
jgi:hypothetical protein